MAVCAGLTIPMVVALASREFAAWADLPGLAVALIGLALAVSSARRATGRVRAVRSWIALGFAAWAGSRIVAMSDATVFGLPANEILLALLSVVVVAAVGAYRANLKGQFALREELAVYLDALVVSAAAIAVLFAVFGPMHLPDSTISLAMIHGMVFFAIVAATLILDLAVLAELRLSGAYAILIGLAVAGVGFVGGSVKSGVDEHWIADFMVSAGVLTVAVGTATWSDRMDVRPRYVSAANRLRGWLPLAAVAVTLVLLLGSGSLSEQRTLFVDVSTAVVLAGTVARQSLLLTERGSLLTDMHLRRERLERTLASQQQLLAITDRLLAHREQHAIFEAVADTLAAVVPHDTLSIYLVDSAAGCLVPILARDEYAEQILAARPLLGRGITGHVIATGEAEIVNNAAADPRVAQVPGTPDEDEAMIVAPIRDRETVIGALNIYRRHHEFSGEDLELVRLFTNHVAIALNNARVDADLREAAVRDPVTGLANRRLFEERISEAIQRAEDGDAQIAVMFLDLDRFKLLNDSLGHAAGDMALRAVAERLTASVREVDTVARFGGDEFGILCGDVSSDEDAYATAERVAAALSQPFAIGARTVSIRGSIGITLGGARNSIGAAELLRQADTAMYAAKASNRGGYRLYEPLMHARQLKRLELEAELRKAIEREDLSLAYQPIFDLPSMRAVGVEALLRWTHDGLSIAPGDFVPLAEESGQIVPLGAWIRSTAFRQLADWHTLAAGKIGLSVNVSARELSEPAFVDSVAGELAATGLDPKYLTLEITESVMLTDETVAVAALRRLRDFGVNVAVDDFGTGYSSLSYLQRLPVNGLKIDRSFIAGLGAEREKTAIVGATIAFAHALDLTVTAEGVETDEQARRLRRLGCGRAQGFGLARPMSARDLTAMTFELVA